MTGSGSAKGPPPSSLHHSVKLSLKLTARLRRWPCEKANVSSSLQFINELFSICDYCRQVKQVNIWSASRGLLKVSNIPIYWLLLFLLLLQGPEVFLDNFSDFHGAVLRGVWLPSLPFMNVTESAYCSCFPPGVLVYWQPICSFSSAFLICFALFPKFKMTEIQGLQSFEILNFFAHIFNNKKCCEDASLKGTTVSFFFKK